MKHRSIHNRLFAVMATALFISFWTQAQYRVVIDPKTIAQVTANTASQTLIETEHNKRVDSIESNKRRTTAAAASIEVIKELYKQSMTNISGFGSESKYYVEIGQCALEIVTLVPRTISAVYSAKLPGQVTCVREITNLELKAQQLVKDFVNICANGKVQNPLKKTEATQGDGYNFLDRNQRLTLANRIYTDLNHIRGKLQRLMLTLQYATWNDALITYSPKDWVALSAGKAYTQTIINQWNGLSK